MRRTNSGLARGLQGVPGVGVPTAGLTGQHLVKKSNVNFDTEWITDVGYGELYIDANVTPLALPTQNVFVVQTGWTADQTSGTTLDGPNGTITILEAGEYSTICSVDIDLTGAHTYQIKVFKNGIAIVGHTRNLRTQANSIVSAVITGIDTFAVNDVLDLRVASLTNAGDAVTIEYANFSVRLI
jgi:hypothetical protein